MKILIGLVFVISTSFSFATDNFSKSHQADCADTVCDLLSSYDCNEPDEIFAVQKACQDVWGGECIKESIKYLSRYEYNEFDELLELTRSCRNVYNLGCLNFTCEKLGRRKCDDLAEIVEINRNCAELDRY